MGRRVNYGFEKRQKEIKRKKKADAKMERRRTQPEGAPGTEGEERPEGGETSESETSESESTPERDPATPPGR